MCSCLRLFQRLCCCLCIFVVKCACYNWWGVNWRRCWWGEHGDKPVGGHGGRFHNSLPLSRDLPAQATTLPTWVRGMIDDHWSVLIHIILGKVQIEPFNRKSIFLKENVGWWEIELKQISMPSSAGSSLSTSALPWLWPMKDWDSAYHGHHNNLYDAYDDQDGFDGAFIMVTMFFTQLIDSMNLFDYILVSITYLFQRPSSLLFTIHTVKIATGIMQ